MGLPLTIAFTTYVMGQGADPWGGPMVFYGLTWIVIRRYLWERHTAETAAEATVQ